jgi:polar amino acid transport system permease protein
MTMVLNALMPRIALRRSVITPLGIAMAAVWVIIFAALAYALVDSISSERLTTYGWRVLMGFGVTLQLVGTSLFIGALISLPVAAGRLSDNRYIGALSFSYTYFFRGTPLIAQIFLIYYGAGQFSPQLKAIGLWWFFRDAFNCAVLSFAMNTAAYQAEILAGAIRTVPLGQREAARALGLHKLNELRKIVLPQALITALRPYGNEVILITKASSIASVITVLDLMGQTRFVFSRSYDLSFYFWAAAFYLVSVEIFSRVVNAVERRITRHLHLRRTAQ